MASLRGERQPFDDCRHAGVELAARLRQLKGKTEAVVAVPQVEQVELERTYRDGREPIDLGRPGRTGDR